MQHQSTHHRLKELRKIQGLTRATLAAAVGTDKAAIARCEAGEPIPHELAPALAAVFGVQISWLTGEVEERSRRRRARPQPIERTIPAPLFRTRAACQGRC